MRFLGRSLSGLFLMAVTLGLLAFAGELLWSSLQERWSSESTPRPAREQVFVVSTVTYTPKTVVPVLQTFGELRSYKMLEIRSSAAGTVVEVSDNFVDGGRVEEGDLLMRIDPTEYADALALARTDLLEAEADKLDAETALEIARDDLAAAERQVELRAAALTRQQDLVDRGVGTSAAVEEASLSLSSAEQAVLTRRQSVASAESRVALAESTLGRRQIAVEEAERRLAETEIRAGFSGTLNSVTVVEGGLVTQNEQVAQLVDPTALEVSFRVSTAQYSRLIDAQGHLIHAEVEVRLDVAGVDLVATGRIDRESAEVGDGQTGRLLFARLDQAPGFRPGDFVTVSIEEPALDNVAVLPASALDAANTVLVVGEDNRLEIAQVELLRRQGDDVLVRADGLEGKAVVSERSPVLGAGIRVRETGQTDAGANAGAAGGVPTASATGGAGAPATGGGEMITLTPERRAALIARVEQNTRMPADARERFLNALNQDEVPAAMVARLENQPGG